MSRLRNTAASGLVALAALSGCESSSLFSQSDRIETSPSFRLGTGSYATDEARKGQRIGHVDNKSGKYTLSGPIVLGTPYYELPHNLPRINELDSVIVIRDDVRMIKNDETRKIRLEFDNLYLPTAQINDDGTIKTRAYFAVDGPFGKRADMKPFEAENVDLGVFTETEKDIRYGIKIIELNGRSFYAPIVEKECIGDGNLPFSLMPVESSSRGVVLETGQQFIDSPEGIYRPIKMTKEEYDSMMRERWATAPDEIPGLHPDLYQIIDTD
ncbi:hypothetical protein COU60_01495 [Candidatus Pacearchaeota archaeon CG10_big_fil_rev_8_21_14_0_10_34_76]|nr:MAG: hypothetical protein COU60_01495 [Candidatus Pacearchaeota archaeon CG10_big_fil_rev_8_21_14_0_10_34_76]